MGKGKKLGDRSELMTKEEMERLIMSVAPNTYFFTLYNTLRFTGRRIGEIYGTFRDGVLVGGIKVKDIDFDNRIMRTQILKTKKRKTKIDCESCKQKTSMKYKFCQNCGSPISNQLGKGVMIYEEPETREIVLKEELIPIIKNLIKSERLKEKDYLFRKYSLPYLKKAIKKHAQAANINKNISLHGVRHYFITQCKRAGMTNEDIAKWTGHKSPEMMNIYDRRASIEIEDKVLKVDL